MILARELMPFEDAQRAIDELCAPLAVEMVPLGEAMGRTAAHEIRAAGDLVPFARSAMDGFAIRAADAAVAGACLPIAGEAFAQAGLVEHRAGTATSIATGAPLPIGADAVVPIEDTVANGATIVIAGAIAIGEHVFPPGEDARRGDVLCAAGDTIRAATLGLLAAGGCSRLAVRVRPRVAVLTTGSEVVDAASEPAYGQIRNSNAPLLAAALAELGASVVEVAHVRDDREATSAALARLCERCELLVTTGGASVGARDYVKAALRDLGATFAFTQTSLRPARPAAFARLGSTVVAVLPGNPASAFVALHEFVGVAIRGFLGRRERRMLRVQARLDGQLRAKAGRTFAAFASLRLDRQGLWAGVLDNQCSALTRTAAECAGFAILPPCERTYEPGTLVDVDIVDWSKVAVSESPL